MTDLRLVDLDRVLDQLRRLEASPLLQAGSRGPSGFLEHLYRHDPSVLRAAPGPPHPPPASPPPPELGVCPGCGKHETVVNVEADLYVCADQMDARAITGLNAKGCGAQWRGARLGSPA